MARPVGAAAKSCPDDPGSGIPEGVHMRKILIALSALALVVGIPTAVLAASGSASSSLDLQASKFTTTTQTISSTTFRAVGGLSGLTICALNQVTADLSVQLTGAPASFRIRQDGGGFIAPGTIRFVPAGPSDSFSFTFLANVAPFEANDHHSFDVEWRSPTGRSTTLQLGTFNLQYQSGTQGC
jgi:hypothetical protein